MAPCAAALPLASRVIYTLHDTLEAVWARTSVDEDVLLYLFTKGFPALHQAACPCAVFPLYTFKLLLYIFTLFLAVVINRLKSKE